MCLVFSNLREKATNSNKKPSQSINQTTNNNQSGDDVTFSLLSDNAIYMHIGSIMQFTDDFFILNNANLSDISAEVQSHYNSDVSKLTYNNRKVLASELDSYKLAFKLTTSKKIISKDLTIYVVDDPKITQYKDSFKVGEEIKIEEILKFDSSITSYNIETSNNLTYIDGKIKIKSAGEGNITASYVVNGVKLIYSFKTMATEIPKYSILINSEDIDALETDLSREYFSFSYELFDLNGQPSVDQKINIKIADENIISLDTNSYPIVSLRLNEVGTTTITITVDDDLNFSKTIKITIK